MKRFALLIALLFPSFAAAQTTQCGPGVFYYSAQVTAGQWEACFASLQAALGYTPINPSGDNMTGPLGVTQLLGRQNTPPASAPGAGAGGGGTAVLNASASDFDFRLTVAAGTSPTGSNAVIATVTFNVNYQHNPHCVAFPANANTAALTTSQAVYGVGSNGPPSTWVLTSGSSGLTASTTYAWDVLCGA